MPNYFATMQVPLRLGRQFTDADDERGAPVAIINEEMAQRYWRHTEVLVALLGRFAFSRVERP